MRQHPGAIPRGVSAMSQDGCRLRDSYTVKLFGMDSRQGHRDRRGAANERHDRECTVRAIARSSPPAVVKNTENGRVRHEMVPRVQSRFYTCRFYRSRKKSCPSGRTMRVAESRTCFPSWNHVMRGGGSPSAPAPERHRLVLADHHVHRLVRDARRAATASFAGRCMM
ncbi:hypothetical protein HPB49_022251 [Dermacentor silvarum]|uniref:Uncharacterized protein n=1 Tax=Dermacentor silvarum TaxID=543639 RepID=A0ACB8CN25_DERSI|nr:hypothetical protein HPB49_022251 [Dermacentor silvarum]